MARVPGCATARCGLRLQPPVPAPFVPRAAIVRRSQHLSRLAATVSDLTCAAGGSAVAGGRRPVCGLAWPFAPAVRHRPRVRRSYELALRRARRRSAGRAGGGWRRRRGRRRGSAHRGCQRPTRAFEPWPPPCARRRLPKVERLRCPKHASSLAHPPPNSFLPATAAPDYCTAHACGDLDLPPESVCAAFRLAVPGHAMRTVRRRVVRMRRRVTTRARSAAASVAASRSDIIHRRSMTSRLLARHWERTAGAAAEAAARR